jgi:hypothetical protein
MIFRKYRNDVSFSLGWLLDWNKKQPTLDIFWGHTVFVIAWPRYIGKLK